MKIAIEMTLNKWNTRFLQSAYESNISFVERERADILVKQAAAITEEDLCSQKGLIILERTDGSEIANRPLLKHSSVLKYVKQYNAHDFNMHNVQCVGGSLLTTHLVKDNLHCVKQDDITNSDFNKISLGFNFLHASVVEPLITLDMDLLNEDEREVDVFFAGKTYFNNNDGQRLSGHFITEHRKNCVDAIRCVPGIETILFDSRVLSRETYTKVMYNSKIVISPWGWGEACYRDYEAILAGCILIKPDSSYVTSYGNIFNDQFCIWTKPDFSDLAEKVKLAMALWEDSREMRTENRVHLIEYYHDFPKIVKSILDI